MLRVINAKSDKRFRFHLYPTGISYTSKYEDILKQHGCGGYDYTHIT